MSTRIINQLPTVTDPQNSDLLPLYVSNAGDTRKLSLSALVEFFRTSFSSPNPITQRYVPVDGQTITMTEDGIYAWLLLLPVGTLATLTIVLPSNAVAADGQEVLVSCTQIVTALTVMGNGSTVNGAPTALVANDAFTLKYNSLDVAWYKV